VADGIEQAVWFSRYCANTVFQLCEGYLNCHDSVDANNGVLFCGKCEGSKLLLSIIHYSVDHFLRWCRCDVFQVDGANALSFFSFIFIPLRIRNYATDGFD
jgi:hypothetical protein